MARYKLYDSPKPELPGRPGLVIACTDVRKQAVGSDRGTD